MCNIFLHFFWAQKKKQLTAHSPSHSVGQHMPLAAGQSFAWWARAQDCTAQWPLFVLLLFLFLKRPLNKNIKMPFARLNCISSSRVMLENDKFLHNKTAPRKMVFIWQVRRREIDSVETKQNSKSTSCVANSFLNTNLCCYIFVSKRQIKNLINSQRLMAGYKFWVNKTRMPATCSQAVSPKPSLPLLPSLPAPSANNKFVTSHFDSCVSQLWAPLLAARTAKGKKRHPGHNVSCQLPTGVEARPKCTLVQQWSWKA